MYHTIRKDNYNESDRKVGRLSQFRD